MAIINNEVYATLLLDDSYLPGALVIARSLRDFGSSKQLVVLVTFENVSTETIQDLKQAFDHVIGVKKITNNDLTALGVMGRPDLASTFTKIALWKQTQFRKIVYLDGDTLPLRAPEELFDLNVPFAAAPELGYPDCFNSGVMVLEPHLDTYHALAKLAFNGTSFDGGDQGLLNIYFDSFHRLSFLYNVELYKTYRLYMPAMNHYREQVSVVHFIGKEKPWHFGASRVMVNLDESLYSKFYSQYMESWWAVHDSLSSHKV